ncbi:VIT1/CCC1 transporter family protein [Pseudomonas asiatica]|uniref:VIT1/CCC1 transporter family protein n=1 Tax=Pseudomonas TaxID=286 RepID=UPI00209B3DCF|nr:MULTISPECIES: VIT1/CCC1 transporter family protein [Pseudomonas]MCO7525248.1 VIT1/CCC1 transporter family protein [Pseudomonas asiatica]MDH4431484.1 VIT1/CCC1 transporter family protein [Pseudomonas shirazica]
MGQDEQPRKWGVLEPIDRITEVIFGLLMAMTFIGSLSVATAGREDARLMLIAALGCNLAWGLADAVIYLLRTWTERTRSRTLLARLQAGDINQGRRLIADTLPECIGLALDEDGLEMLRGRLLRDAARSLPARLGLDDFKAALATFLLVVLATFPMVIPFLLIETTGTAIRVSNLVALAMLFLAGWLLARYSGGRTLLTGVVLAVVGASLIVAIIALGG